MIDPIDDMIKRFPSAYLKEEMLRVGFTEKESKLLLTEFVNNFSNNKTKNTMNKLKVTHHYEGTIEEIGEQMAFTLASLYRPGGVAPAANTGAPVPDKPKAPGRKKEQAPPVLGGHAEAGGITLDALIQKASELCDISADNTQNVRNMLDAKEANSFDELKPADYEEFMSWLNSL